MEVLAVLFVLALIAGWFLGVIAFFKVLSARSEIAALRRRLEALASGDTAPASVPFVPPVVTEPAAEPPPFAAEPAEPLAEAPPRPDIEALLTARWGVWLGAAALVLAGIFLVRYAVEQGLLGPATPLCSGRAAGPGAARGGRVAAPTRGTAARHDRYCAAGAGGRRRRRAVRRRLWRRRALRTGAAAGGLRAAGRRRADGTGDLAAPRPAGRRRRHRRRLRHPCAGADRHPSLPGLFGYLLFVTATALAVVRYTAWIWLGWATTVAGAVWVLLAMPPDGRRTIWAPALFVPAAAALNLGLLPAAALDHPIGRAWPGCRARRSARPGCCWRCLSDWATRIGVLLFVPLIDRGAAAPRPGCALLPFLAGAAVPAAAAAGRSRCATARTSPSPRRAGRRPWCRTLLATAALIAGCFAASGLWFERRAACPLPWASLAASVPVLTLAVGYARVANSTRALGWALFGPGCWRRAHRRRCGGAARGGSRERAGVHAAGAVAALALGCAMLLRTTG